MVTVFVSVPKESQGGQRMYREYRVIPRLGISCQGPLAAGPNGEAQCVHLQQGDLDGACGPYAVMMGLLALGLVGREEVTGWSRVDGRTSIGKLMARMSEGWTTLFRDGTDLDDLSRLLRGVFCNSLGTVAFSGAGVGCRTFVQEQLLSDSPVVLCLQGVELAHWVLAIGLEFTVEEERREVQRFLILDPSAALSPACSWNGLIDARGSGGRYPYSYWATDGCSEAKKVSLESALALIGRPQEASA